MPQNKDVKKIKDLLHIPSFSPYFYEGEIVKDPTFRVIIRTNFHSETLDRLRNLCNKKRIEDCLFIDRKKRSIFFLINMNTIETGLFWIGFVSLKDHPKYYKKDLESFISFLDKENSLYE